MRYSIEPRERRYVKGYRFSSFARNLGTHATKVVKNLNIMLAKKYEKKDIYLHKEDKKLLMN